MSQISFVSSYINVLVFKSEKSQSLAEVAKAFNTYTKNIICESENVKTGDFLIIDLKKDNIHIVKPAETLLSIAQKYNISVQALKEKNKTERIFIGQQLYL